MTFLQATKRGGDAQLQWYMEQWTKINKKYFKGELPKPRFRFLKDTGIKMSRRGQYSPMSNTFGFSRYLFNATEEQVLTTLKHEIAHQAVRTIDKVTRGEVHGPLFKKWCRKLGISEKSTDDIPTIDYMDPKKKKQLLQKEKEIKDKLAAREEESAKAAKTFKPIPYWAIKENTPAQYFSPDKKIWIKGLIVARNDQGAKRWIFITEPYASKWLIVPAIWFHEVSDKDKKEYTSKSMMDAAQEIRGYVNKKKARSTELKILKKRFR